MIDTTVRLVGNGYTVTLTNTAEQLHRRPGGSGWGMAPVSNSWFEGAGDGARLRGTRRVRRELGIPISAFGNSPREVERAVRDLVRIVRDPFRVYVDIDGGNTFWIDAVYESGAEGVYTTAPEFWNEVNVVLSCPDPFWTSEQSQSFTIAPEPASTPFLTDFSALNVASAAAFGEVAVTNVGDVDSEPTWTIHGPGTNLTIEVNGEGFTLVDKTLTASDIITVQLVDGGWTITDQNGVNQYGFFGTTTPFFPVLPPGASIVTASMSLTGVESYITAVYPERREVVY